VVFKEVPKSHGRQLIPKYTHIATYSDYKPQKRKEECKYWSSKNGIKDEDKALKEIQKILDSASKDVANKAYDGKFKKLNTMEIKGRNIPVDKVLTTINIIKKIDLGNYKGAAEDVSSEFISYMLPIAGQYKALLDTTKTAINSVIANWVEDMYATQSYNWIRKRLNKEVLMGAKRRDPFYPTPLLKRSSPIYNKMFKIERAMYQEWKMSQAYDEDFFTSKGSSALWARLRQKLGHQPLPVEIFNHFYLDVIKNQKSYIEITYERVMEDKMYDEAADMKTTIIEAVCRDISK